MSEWWRTSSTSSESVLTPEAINKAYDSLMNTYSPMPIAVVSPEAYKVFQYDAWCRSIGSRTVWPKPAVKWWPNVPLAILALWWRRIAVVLVVGTLIVVALMAVAMNVGGNTSKSSSEAGVVTAMGTTVQEAAVRSVIFGDGSVTLTRQGSASRSLSSAISNRQMSITVRHGSPTTLRSEYEVPVTAEVAPWPTTRWSCVEIAEAAAIQGFTNTVLVARIVMAESGGRSDAMAVTRWERSVGPVQVNTLVHRAYSDECLRSLSCSLAAMWRISSQGTNFSPWSAFKSGKHEGMCA